MTCEVSGSATCKNSVMNNWAQGRGVFLTTPEPPLAFILPLGLGVRLAGFEGPIGAIASGSRSVVSATAGTC